MASGGEIIADEKQGRPGAQTGHQRGAEKKKVDGEGIGVSESRGTREHRKRLRGVRVGERGLRG